jgi:hypothetical protein
MALQKGLMIDVLQDTNRYCTHFMRHLISILSRNGSHPWDALSQIKKANTFVNFPVLKLLSKVCQRMPTPPMDLEKVAHMSLLPHLPLRWLVNGESRILDEFPIMLMDAYMTIDPDHSTIWRRPFRERRIHAGRIESIFRDMDAGIMEASATLKDMLDKGIQGSSGPDFQRLLDSISLGNRPLSKVSNGKFRRMLTHKDSLNAPSRPWQDLWKAPICHRDFTLWWRGMHGRLPSRSTLHRYMPENFTANCTICQNYEMNITFSEHAQRNSRSGNTS